MSPQLVKPSRIYLIVILIWLLLIAVGMAASIAFDLQRAEKLFLDNVNGHYREASERLRINESVLDGFAAMVSASNGLDRERIRVYAQQMLKQYPHIFMFEIVETVPRERVESFIEHQRRTVAPDFEIKAFGFATDRRWRAVEDKPHYMPIIFMQPFLDGSREVLGLDLDSTEFLRIALLESRGAERAAITIPFKLVEGDWAYLISRRVPQTELPGGVSIGENASIERFVALVIRTNTLLDRGVHPLLGMREQLYHPEFDKTDPAGHLYLNEGPAVSRLESRLFPRYRVSRVVENDSQPFELLVEQQLGWHVLSWGRLGLILLIGTITFAVVTIYARLYHRNEVKRMETADRLFYLANHDVLTGLANRNLLVDRLDHAIAQTSRQHKQLAVLFLDLEDFKGVNDSYGHDAGDSVLKRVAERLRACVRVGDTIARLGGDEFVLILENIYGQEDVDHVVEKIKNAFEQPFKIKSHTIQIGVSVGMAVYPQNGKDFEALLSHADLTMYDDKRSK